MTNQERHRAIGALGPTDIELKRRLLVKSKIPTGEALKQRALELGVVNTLDDPNEPDGNYRMFRAVVSESELQQRVMAAENMISAQRAWRYAALSGAASLVTAFAALLTVHFQH